MSDVKYRRALVSVQDMCNFIKKGESYLKGEYVENIEILQAIILNPPYQRNYRSSQKEESSIIESIIMGVPIPEVFLIRIRNNESQVRNVMDGKHRLNSIYRFITNQYKLVGLRNENEKYNGYLFNDLPTNIKIKILTEHLSVLEFEPLETPEIEIDLFTRYNKNTKPLQKQEINYASYSSKTSDFVSQFILKDLTDDILLTKIYNVTKDRKQKQTIHQNIFAILHILEEGLDFNFNNSQSCSEEYMKKKSNEIEEDVENTEMVFSQYNEMIKKLSTEVDYPFSNLIYSIDADRNYKFQIGIAMYLAAIFHYFDVNKDGIFEDIHYIMKMSHIADKNYSGSSTSRLSMIQYLSKINNKDLHVIKRIKDLPVIDKY